MEIEVSDVSKMRWMVGDRLASSEPDTVMVFKYAGIDENSIHFLKGPEDFQEFMATEPDVWRYEQLATENLYELLSRIDDKDLTPRFVIRHGVKIEGLIDLGSMLEDRDIIENIEVVIAKLDWMRSEESEDLFDQGPGLKEEIILNLKKLCKDDSGVAVANSLWEKYSNVFGSERPIFIASKEGEWFKDSQLKALGPAGTVTVVEQPALTENGVKLNESNFRVAIAALGSQLDFSDASILAGRTDGIVTESQYFGRPGKLDRIDVNWHLEGGRLVSYDVSLRKYIDVPDRLIAGIELRELEGRLKRFDWTQEYLNFNEGVSLINGIANDIRRLYDYARSPDARELALKIGLKYWGYTPNEDIIPGISELKADYEKHISLKPGDGMLSILQVYNLLDGRAIGQTNSEGVWNWTTLDPTGRESDGSRILMEISAARGFDPMAALRDIGGQQVSLEEVIFVRNGSKMMLHMELDGVTAERIVFVDPFRQMVAIDKVEGENYGLYRVSDEELFRGRSSRQREGLHALTERADYLGIHTEKLRIIENEVLTRNSGFSIEQSESLGSDLIKYKVNVDYDGKGRFEIGDVHVDLRRDYTDGLSIGSDTSIADLHQRMGAVDWSLDFTSTGSMVFHLGHPGGKREMQMTVLDIRAGLESLAFGGKPDEAAIAQSLATVFLAGTPNEKLVRALVKGMEENRWRVSFPSSPEFTFNAMYNLMDGRFAMARTIDAEGKPERKNWYRLSKGALDGVGLPVSMVSSGFSVLDALKKYDVFETKIPAMAQKTAWELEDGGLLILSLNPKVFPKPVMVYAHPGIKGLVVHLGETCRLAGDIRRAPEYASTRIELGLFSKIAEQCENLEGVLEKIGSAEDRGQSDSAEERGEQRRSRGQ